jgi:hypothetical protein
VYEGLAMDDATIRMLLLGRQAPPVRAIVMILDQSTCISAYLVQFCGCSSHLPSTLRTKPVTLQKAIDLKLEPRTYVSPNHAPVADVSYRVEVPLLFSCFSSVVDSGDLDMAQLLPWAITDQSDAIIVYAEAYSNQ